jgi:hypothetical protein
MPYEHRVGVSGETASEFTGFWRECVPQVTHGQAPKAASVPPAVSIWRRLVLMLISETALQPTPPSRDESQHAPIQPTQIQWSR